VTRTAHRISAEVSLVSALPGLDVAAKEAVLLAVSRSRYPNLDAYSKAKAEVQRCRMDATRPPDRRFWMRWMWPKLAQVLSGTEVWK
jgi:hypothetical protein